MKCVSFWNKSTVTEWQCHGRSEPFHDCHDRFNGSAMQSDRNVVSSLVVHEPSSHSLTVSAEVSGADSLES